MDNIKALYQIKGSIEDMGLKYNTEEVPVFYVKAEGQEELQVRIDNGMSIAMVRDWLDIEMNTGLQIEFKDFGQFNDLIKKVLEIKKGE